MYLVSENQELRQKADWKNADIRTEGPAAAADRNGEIVYPY